MACMFSPEKQLVPAKDLKGRGSWRRLNVKIKGHICEISVQLKFWLEVAHGVSWGPSPKFSIVAGLLPALLSPPHHLGVIGQVANGRVWEPGRLGGEQPTRPNSVCSQSCSPGFRKSLQVGKAACCFDCTPFSEDDIANETECLPRAETFLDFREPLGMVLACMALGLSTLTAVVLGVFLNYQNTPIVKANNQILSYILLICLIVSFLCSLLFIGHPNTVTCILQQVTFGLVFTIAVSSVLAKTVTVVLAFKVTSPERWMRRLPVSGASNFIIPISTLIQMTLCGIWLGTSPPFIDIDAHSEHGYLGFLALISFIVAFQARNLPDTFNEAKFLTFSMLLFCSVWLTFLPVYNSTKGKLMVATEVFSILTSSAGLLGCIFVPKSYIILLRPDRNFLPGFQDKTQTGRNKLS
ncbi:vomeronasal type-2 receptor 116-like [Thomomys bottae]